jgi:LCP family protein required for cell wall assembly
VDVDAESATPAEEPLVGDVPEPVDPDSATLEPVVPEPAKSPESLPPEPAPTTGPDHEVRRHRHPTAARVGSGVGKSLLALASAAILGVTGYNWAILHQLDQGIARTDVFDTATAPTPAGGPAPAVAPPLTSDVNILLVGMDSRTDPHGNPLPANELAMLHAGPNDGELNTDTMILVHIPAGGQQATAISFPRDSYVHLAGGFGWNRLNSAFAYAHNATVNQLRTQGMTDSAQIEQQADTAGRKNLIATIEQLIGNTLTINRYAEINLGGFYAMSQAVGGVQVCLKAATHDDATGASFPAGVQTISGVQALNFVRQRHGLPQGDLDRITRQQVFLGALANKILSTGTLTSPSRIAALSTAIQNSVTLSSGWDITSFAAQMQGLTSGAIRFSTIPTGANIVVGGADVIQIDPAQVQAYVTDLINQTPSSTPTAPATTTTPATGTSTVTETTPPAVAKSDTSSTSTDNAPITASGLRCVN